MKTLTSLAVALLALVSTAVPSFASGSGVTVTLPLRSEVRGTEIELGEVALVTGLDAEEVEVVRAFDLGYAPAPGFSRLLTAERIRQALVRQMPNANIRVTGERACRVWPQTDEILPEALETTARAELTRSFLGKEASFTLKDSLPRTLIPRGEQGFELVARAPTGDLGSGILGVPIEIWVDGLRYRTIWTSWRVDVWETRTVLSRPIAAGAELSPSDFERTRVRVGRENGLQALTPAEVLGSVARHDLSPGAAVTGLDVHRPPAVTLGATLFLRVRKGAIEARVSAVALETGTVGERIRVRSSVSGQEMQATVVARDLCEVVL
jgi:flagella basal body P-ring formation protein FlgA